MIAIVKKTSFVTRPFAASQNQTAESDLDFLKVLPYLWQGGSFKQLIHLAIELDTGVSIVRSRCQKLANWGIVQSIDDDSYEVTELGKDFCQLTYGKLSDAEAVLDKVPSELQQLALAHAQAHPEKNKGRIKLLTSPEPTASVETVQGFWRARSGLHPVSIDVPEETIACHLLPIPDQIELCRQRIAQQQERLEDIRENKPAARQKAARQKVQKEVDQIIAEECDRISRLSAFLLQPSWVLEAQKELSEACAGNEDAFKEAVARYSQLAIECGYKLNMQSAGDGNNILVWVEEDATITVEENQAESKSTTANNTGFLEGKSTGSESEEIGAIDLQQSSVNGKHNSPSALNSNGNGRVSSQQRQGGDLVLRQETSEVELTLEEERERTLLEKRVEQGLYSAWAALRDIREKRLYRPETWEAYCLRRFGYKADNADWKIHACAVYETLEANLENLTISKEKLPSSEQQVRAMRTLPKEQWLECWEKACEQAPGRKPPAGRVVRDVVLQLKGIVVTVPSNFKLGDVVVISKPRALDGCWGIVENVGEFTITVATWKESVQLEEPSKTTRLVDIPVEKSSILDIWKRCKALRECPDLDPSVYWVLEGLGRCTYLTPMQENLLTMFEAEYL